VKTSSFSGDSVRKIDYSSLLPQRYQQGLKQIEEYVIGEDSDQELLGIFYVVFDATKSKRAKAYLGQEFSTETVCDRDVGVVIIDLSPPKPSRKL